jgi:hypothetical protein
MCSTPLAATYSTAKAPSTLTALNGAGGAPPSVKNPYPATVAFTLHAECNQGAVVLDEMGYGYWANSRCSGIRYEVTNGTVSY